MIECEGVSFFTYNIKIKKSPHPAKTKKETGWGHTTKHLNPFEYGNANVPIIIYICKFPFLNLSTKEGGI